MTIAMVSNLSAHIRKEYNDVTTCVPSAVQIKTNLSNTNGYKSHLQRSYLSHYHMVGNKATSSVVMEINKITTQP